MSQVAFERSWGDVLLIFFFFSEGGGKKEESIICTLKDFTLFCQRSTVHCVSFGRTQLVPPVCLMARRSPGGHTLLLCFCSVLIFREQLFQRINTLPRRRNSGKHPASDSGSRCPSRWMSPCQNRRGFASWPAKGRGLQAVSPWGATAGQRARVARGKNVYPWINCEAAVLLTQNVVPGFILTVGPGVHGIPFVSAPLIRMQPPRLLGGGTALGTGRSGNEPARIRPQGLSPATPPRWGRGLRGRAAGMEGWCWATHLSIGTSAS